MTQIEFLQIGKDGIMAAEYMTELPPKKGLEAKLHQTLIEGRARFDKNNFTKKAGSLFR